MSQNSVITRSIVVAVAHAAQRRRLFAHHAPRTRHVHQITQDVLRKIIDQLVRARREAGMTQAEVGKRIGQRHHYISEIERGIFEAPLAVVARYARAVDLPWIEV